MLDRDCVADIQIVEFDRMDMFKEGDVIATS